jgi:hypothetical protein
MNTTDTTDNNGQPPVSDPFDIENLRLKPGDLERLHAARRSKSPRPRPVTVLAPETPVLLAGEIRATVMAAAVRAGPHINYQVVWWSGLDRHEEWVYAAEVERVEQVRGSTAGITLTEANSPGSVASTLSEWPHEPLRINRHDLAWDDVLCYSCRDHSDAVDRGIPGNGKDQPVDNLNHPIRPQ